MRAGQIKSNFLIISYYTINQSNILNFTIKRIFLNIFLEKNLKLFKITYRLPTFSSHMRNAPLSITNYRWNVKTINQWTSHSSNKFSIIEKKNNPTTKKKSPSMQYRIFLSVLITNNDNRTDNNNRLISTIT